jgi:hypothetical protein
VRLLPYRTFRLGPVEVFVFVYFDRPWAVRLWRQRNEDEASGGLQLGWWRVYVAHRMTRRSEL